MASTRRTTTSTPISGTWSAARARNSGMHRAFDDRGGGRMSKRRHRQAVLGRRTDFERELLHQSAEQRGQVTVVLQLEDQSLFEERHAIVAEGGALDRRGAKGGVE